MRAIRWHDETYALGLLVQHGDADTRSRAIAELGKRATLDKS
jgi:hypothetical protein